MKDPTLWIKQEFILAHSRQIFTGVYVGYQEPHGVLSLDWGGGTAPYVSKAEPRSVGGSQGQPGCAD